MSTRRKNALLLVDVQYDFLPGGALPTDDGDAVIAPIRRLALARRYHCIVATQDWHPPGHISFASSHRGRRALETIALYGHEQVLWPDHCVPGTHGARLHEALPLETVDAIIRKGTDPSVDSYSAFRNNWDERGQRPPTGLAGYLRERGVEQVDVCGLARDYCVLWTAEDAAEAGFTTEVLWDLTRPVDPGADDAVRRALFSKGIGISQAAA